MRRLLKPSRYRVQLLPAFFELYTQPHVATHMLSGFSESMVMENMSVSRTIPSLISFHVLPPSSVRHPCRHVPTYIRSRVRGSMASDSTFD